ncbi:Conserved_hypothetical protein [Hexamita inflata]|uniref:Uncharacterized protein n=1 Tax=Hexamita inflata TaxID=28002 RepID=A0AA86R783_9EUKA|nr:Conserved hypothetical protein [Hexamita inflata]
MKYMYNPDKLLFRYLDQAGKYKIYGHIYRKIQYNHSFLIKLNQTSPIDDLQFLFISQYIVLGEYINILPLNQLHIYNSHKTQFGVNLNILNQTNGNETIDTLRVSNYYIQDESLLTKFHALQNLILEGTDFKDFSVLKNLKLSYLQIKDNRMSFQDKRTICQLTSLYQLHLDNCGFREVHLLQDLTQLRELTLKNNSLVNSDFMACEFRLLQKLDVSYNLLKSLDYLTALSPCLVELNASHNKIGKLFYSDEHDVINIEILNLSYNKLFDINQLTRFTNLKELNLQSNKLGEKRVKVLKQLQIQSLNLTSIQCRTLNCLNTKSVINVVMFNQVQNFNSFNIFSCQNLHKMNIYSAEIPNQKLEQLNIVKQSTEIISKGNYYGHEYFGNKNSKLDQIRNSLHYYLQMKSGNFASQINYYLHILYKYNFYMAIQRKCSGYQQKQQEEKNTFQLVNVKTIQRQKLTRNHLQINQIIVLTIQLSIVGYE